VLANIPHGGAGKVVVWGGSGIRLAGVGEIAGILSQCCRFTSGIVTDLEHHLYAGQASISRYSASAQ
jgi:hypothetical protein